LHNVLGRRRVLDASHEKTAQDRVEMNKPRISDWLANITTDEGSYGDGNVAHSSNRVVDYRY
jgi:hypothetical protein